MFGNEGFGLLSVLFRAADGGSIVDDFLRVVGEGGLSVRDVNSCVPCPSGAKDKLDP